MRIILLSFLFLTLPFIPANAADAPLVIEVFTYPGCDPIELKTYYNADGTTKKPTDIDKKFNKKHVGNVFEDIIKEHPNAIALHYFNDIGYHAHDENDNDIASETVSEELSEFIRDQSYINYRNQSFLEQSLNAQMVINGIYPVAGTMKHVADAAISRSQNEQKITPIKLAINGQNLKVELPESITAKSVTPVLIGYDQKQKIDDNRAIPAINPTNIVTSFKKLAVWNGESRSQTISIAGMSANGFALIAQDEYTGEIYGAGKVELPINQSQQ